METANIQQALAIYRLSDALIPTAVVGNVMPLTQSNDEFHETAGHLQLRWSSFDGRGNATLHGIESFDGWELCKKQLGSYLTVNPLNTIQLSTTPKEIFFDEVNAIKSMILDGKGNKIVAARTLSIEKSVDAESLWESFMLLCDEYPKAFVFMLFDPNEGCWLGATPERLIRWNGGEASIMSLAGTLTQAQSDWTGKERNEQSVTSRFIQEKVLEMGIAPTETVVKELVMGNIRHLVSDWCFPLERDRLPDLIDKLHPTPAVGGYPQGWAVDWILKNEGFDRGLYAGFIGVETDEFASYHVVLRCCQLGSNGYVLYAGCGVNADSDAETEWRETSAKMQLISAYL